jgi:hypothetical protein
MNCIGKQAQATNKVYTRLTSPEGGEVCCRDINMRPQGGLTETRLLMFARKTNIDIDSTINTGFNDGATFINVASSGAGVNGNTIVRLANVPIAADLVTIPTKIGVSELYIDSAGFVKQRLL